MTFPTDAATITVRKFFGISIAIFVSSVLRYRFAARGCAGRPAAKCVLTLRNCSRTQVDRVATAVPGPRPRMGRKRPAYGSETTRVWVGNDEKGIIAGHAT